MSVAQLQTFDPSELLGADAESAVDALLRHATDLQASDLYLHSDESCMTIAVRRFGEVQRVAVVSKEQGRQWIRHIKAMAGMSIADDRRPQDGRWIHEFLDTRVDLRINCIASLFGIDMSLRIWDRERGLLELDQLGLSAGALSKFQSALNRPSGLVLVTGPTGAGKTTTLYACLQHLNNGRRKINTLEDPVEYALAGVRQSQVNPKLGVDFPQLLRSVLRQAPDAIMIGEIRDEETAGTAVRAANSGHLVLATLHAPTAAGAVQSLLALGAHPYFLSSCLLGIVAQRLVRTLCAECRTPFDISEAPMTFESVAPLLAEGEGLSVYGPNGCEACFETGYSGRTGIFEWLSLNQNIRRLIARSAPARDIHEEAIKAGMIEFRRAALLKVAQGATCAEDVLRDVPAEHLGLED